MSSINQMPDGLSLSGNLKKFEISSDTGLSFILQQGQTVILNEKYQPDSNNLVTIDVSAIVDRLLDIVIPTPLSINVFEQTAGVLDFTATIDTLTPISFRVIKGGVAQLQELTATPWLESHFLSWQPQTKYILQEAPEWLGIYPISAGTIKVKAFFADGSSYEGIYTTLEAGKLYSINTSWGEIAEWLASVPIIGLPIAWDVWYDVGVTRMTPIQRYQLRNMGCEEHVFVWVNTIGGIDSVSFTGASEEDQKLDHKNAIYQDETIGEYDIEKAREVRQSTGYLDTEESFWLKDFFYSRRKYVVRADGSLKPIALVSSKIVGISTDDQFDYEFTYRFGEDGQLLNLERTHTVLPAPEGLAAFFLTELLSSLTEASYQDNLIMAVQSPFAIGWQKLSMAQLWGGALPGLIDGITIKIFNGKLTATCAGEGGGVVVVPSGDTRTELISGTILYRSGLTYQSTIIEYKIIGTHYTAQSKVLTLAPSDPNLDRMDTFYVDQYSNLQVKTGIASANPASPILTSRQLEVMTVLVRAGSLVPADIDIELVYDENNPGSEWGTSSSQQLPNPADPDVTVDFESLSEPLNGIKRIKVGITIPDSTVNRPVHYVGEPYGGGIIIKIFDSEGKTGLIVAAEDTAQNVFWESLSGGQPYTTGASGIDIGTGQSNTALMLANDRAKDQAVSFCNNLIVGEFTDWYMPSQAELMEIYFQRMKIPGLANKTYWSSTEETGQYDWKRARCISFSDGVVHTIDKNNTQNVRAIRSFDDSLLPVNVPVPAYAPQDVEMTFVSPGEVIVTDGILSMNIKSSQPWLPNSTLLIDSYLGPVRTGTAAMSANTNLFHYKPGEDSWQLIAIQMYNFAPTKPRLDCFKIRLEGSWPNNIDLGFDDIRFQHSNIIITELLKHSSDRTDYHFTESPDNARTEFTTLYPFIANTTKVHLNGVRQIKEEGMHYMENGEKIVFDYPPEADSGFVIDYKTYIQEG